MPILTRKAPASRVAGRSLGARLSQCALIGVAVTLGFIWPKSVDVAASEGDLPFVLPGRGYHDHGGVEHLLDRWCAVDRGRVRRLDLGRTKEGRRVPAIEFSGQPFPTDARDARGTVLLIGGLDGVSLAGSEAVLRSTHTLLSGLNHLRQDIRFVAIPWGNPDALARTHAAGGTSGGNSSPLDEDGDGAIDEDPGEDLDGDGQILEMLIPSPDGEWCLSGDGRRLLPASSMGGARYHRMPEGRDTDGDGRFNEDGAGGVRLDRQFPVGWTDPGPHGENGAFPLSEPVARRIAELIAGRPIALALDFDGQNGGIRYGRLPGSSASDVLLADRIDRMFERSTGRSALNGRVEHQGGSLVDWMGEVLGIPSVQVAVWGPDVIGPDGRPRRGPSLSAGPEADGAPSHSGEDAWFRWVDDVRGGVGHVTWHPVDAGHGVKALVGGWEPRTRMNPPVDELEACVSEMPSFVVELIEGLPQLEIQVLEIERRGDMVTLGARIANVGEFPTRAGLSFGVHAACDASVLAGPLDTPLDALEGGAVSRTVSWVLRVPEGGAIELLLRAGGEDFSVREVRP